MRIFVAGGTGVVGRPLVQRLVDLGHEVTASARSAERLPIMEAIGARPVLMDGLDKDAVREAVLSADPEVIINQVTSLAVPSGDYGTWLAATNQLRIEGTDHLMRAAAEAGSRRVVAQSASFMTEPHAPGRTTEESPLYRDGPEPLRSHVRANEMAEERVLGTPGVEGVVLRYGFLYGTGTSIGPGGDIAEAVRAGEMPVVGEGVGRYPFVHVHDAVSATVQAVDKGSVGVYNVVDDEPAPQSEWLPYLADLLRAPEPRHVSEKVAASQFGVQAVYYGNQLSGASNAKAKVELRMALEYGSWREGFQALFGSPAARAIS